MGVRNPSESTSVSSTSKVIMADGELREFAETVTAAQVLRKNPGCFVCDADDMEFDGYVTAAGAGEELRPRGLYFVLPRSMLKRRLQPEEMAALAVKASAALVKGGAAAAFGDGMGGEAIGGRRGVPVPVPVPVGGFSVESGVEQRRGKGSGRGRNFTTKLGAIPE